MNVKNCARTCSPRLIMPKAEPRIYALTRCNTNRFATTDARENRETTMLQTATIKSPTAHATSKAHGADASNRPAPAAQDAKKSAAETADGFATELNSADIVQ